MSDTAAQEFDAIKSVHGALEPLPEEARARVLGYVASLLGIAASVPKPGKKTAADDPPDEEEDGEEEGKAPKPPGTYATFAELYAAANPNTNGEKALVAGYWFQVCQGQENFTAAVANKELTHLGHAVPNITEAINTVKDQKPALVLQTKKTGTAKQARKIYKVSHEGVKKVEAMLGG